MRASSVRYAARVKVQPEVKRGSADTKSRASFMRRVRFAGSGSKGPHFARGFAVHHAAKRPREEVAVSNKRSAKEVLEYLAERVRRIESETHNVAEILERMAARLPTPPPMAED